VPPGGSQGFLGLTGADPVPHGKIHKCIPPPGKIPDYTQLTVCIYRYLDRYFLVIDEFSTRQYDVLTGRSGGFKQYTRGGGWALGQLKLHF